VVSRFYIGGYVLLLTITYRGENTQDLGYLLYKNPARPQSVQLSMGRAYIFYPEVSDEETTVALLVSLDPLDLAKGKTGSLEKGLFAYVNDRPYVASSFMTNAINRVFGTAMTGRCDSRPELAASELDLEAKIYMLPVRLDWAQVYRDGYERRPAGIGCDRKAAHRNRADRCHNRERGSECSRHGDHEQILCGSPLAYLSAAYHVSL